jgi:hypothetical protein
MGAPLHWKLKGMAAKGAAQFDVVTYQLPEGYEAWVYSSARQMRWRLLPGVVVDLTSDLPSGQENEVEVFAAPANWIQNRLGQIPEKIESFSASLGRMGDLWVLDLSWPQPGPLHLTLYDTQGRRLSKETLTLGEGRYRHALQAPQGAMGIRVLTLQGRTGTTPIRKTLRWVSP